jgi:hypothetical protein
LISLRSHIVSIVAVFLALGLGIVLGSSVVSTPLESRLNDDLRRYKDQRDEAVGTADELRSENDVLRRRLSSQVAPWAVHDRLSEVPIVVVSEASPAPDWRKHVVDAVASAGAQPQGSILLTERWRFDAPEDEAELLDAMRSVTPTFVATDEDGGLGSAALGLLGERFLEPTGRALIEVLEREGFLTVQGRGDDDGPPPGSVVAVLSPAVAEQSEETDGPSEPMLEFARRVADVTPTLVATNDHTQPSAVSILRDASGLPDRLATFDSATEDGDPGGVGVVAAFEAAVEGRGGHFGAERGRAFVAPPGSAS